MKKKRIITPHGVLTELAKIFNVSTITISSAVNYKTQSELAKKIRKAAIDYGGIIVDVPEK